LEQGRGARGAGRLPRPDPGLHQLAPFILNYFEHPVTNAYTESLNSLIRVMNRLGRGYSFEALRAKILFTEGAHKHKLSRPKFERRREPDLAMAEEVAGYGLPPGHFGKAVLTPRKSLNLDLI
jgi:transposase